jgi:signal transduction histidine kinase/ActR/RegA family two-component response regulator
MAPKAFPNPVPRAHRNERNLHVRAGQIRLLYDNATTGIAVTAVAAPLLAYLLSPAVPHPTLLAWLAFMLVICFARGALLRYYRHASFDRTRIRRWGAAFTISSGLAGTGWGSAGVFLFPSAELASQMFLVFVLGGMMLGGAVLLAARPEAFLAFLLPAGLLPALRLAAEGDKAHVVMGFLAAMFTAVTVTTTCRSYRMIESSLKLQFQNEDLVEDLKIAGRRTEALNQQLELRVQERTAELHEANMRLRAEMDQRQQTEDELLRVRNLESLGVLAGGIAHDFNNFLTVIQGNIELAKMQVAGNADIVQVLEDSGTACRRASFLASQLLTFAKGGAPVRRVLSVAKLVTDAIQLARAGAPAGITVEIAEDLWSAEVDGGQIGQVLHNLLLNAKQAMPDGGIIEVRAANAVLADGTPPGPGSYVRISVKDYGPGIASELLPRIFDPYFTTKRGGSGLGLATVYAIVSKHGGHISAESTLGHGTEFVVLLPASGETSAPESTVAAPLRRGTGRLLVMDDEDTLRTLLSRILTTMGYDVQCAREGAQAIALYETAKAMGAPFDAVLLDLTVSGGMGGVETASKLKELDPSVKLIVSSGYSDDAVMSQYRDYGFDDMITKPWQAAHVSEVFERVLLTKAAGNAS